MAERKAYAPLTPVLNEKATAELSVLNSKLHDRLKEDLNREIYTRNVLKHKEDAVVAQIKVVSCGAREVDSPESDVFVTPKASPCEPIPFSKQPFPATPPSNNSVTRPADKHVTTPSDDLINRSHYYSLVHVEEDLSRELAEQDALSNSFRSILEKQEQEEENRKPTVLDFTGVTVEKEPVEYKPKSITEQRAKTLKVLNKQYTYTLAENEMNGGGKEGKEEEVSLEAVSSGYMTGGSPRDTREDVTEVASTEDIPHDDRSPSSVSSDQGTWDSTFPTNEENTFIEKDVELESVSSYQTDMKSEPASLQLENHINFSNPTSQDKCLTSKGNFFIDASSLRDEDETYMSSFEFNPSLTSTKSSEPKTTESTVSSIKTVDNNKADLVIRSLEDLIETNLSDFSKDIQKEENATAETLENNKEEEETEQKKEGNKGVENLENRKIIRRNTFELNPDDDKLALLKEEYERVNGFKKGEEPKVNVSKTDDIIPTPVAVSAPSVEEDHSPDSLNNDFPYESFAVETQKEESITELQSSNENVKISSPVKMDQPQIPLNMSALSDLSNSSGPNSSLSASGISSKREVDTTDDTNSSTKNDKGDVSSNKDSFPIMPSNTQTQISDLSASSDYSLTASPLMSRRRNEFAPILSGGCDILPEVRKPKLRSTNSMNASWIVDMSNSGKSPPDSACEFRDRQRNSNSGMGFFVPLEDPYPSIDSVTSNSSERSDSAVKRYERSSSCGFYIDLKNDSDSENCLKRIKDRDTPQPEKKLFSMFIDIGNGNGKDSTCPNSKPSSPFLPLKKKKAPNYIDRLSAKNLDKKSTSTSSDSGLDCGEHPEITKGKMLFDSSIDQGPQSISDSSANDSACSTKRQSFYMFIEAEESPVTRRRTLPSGMKHSANRHSWNNDKKHMSETIPIKEHKRSSSISYDSNLKLDLDDRYKSGPASIDEISINHRKSKMNASWHSQVKPSNELSRIIANGAQHEFRECKNRKNIEAHSDNEGVDKGQDDLCNSVKSEEQYTDISGSSKDRTFVIDEVSKAVNVNTNDLELSTPSHDIISDLSKDDTTETDPAVEIRSSGSNDELTPKQVEMTMTSQPIIKETKTEELVGFVKLSDMDNQPAKMWKSQEVKSGRMSRSIPEGGSWLETKMMANSSSSRSLSRLFPHLYPGRMFEGGGSDTDFSNQSSMQSSINPSPLELSTEGTEGSCTSGGPCSRLGEDLLRMFLDEISPDVTVDVGGRRIKAHKCILSSRCQYFAGMLSGGWVESAGNVISLQGFSYNAVHFALCHIYSGASNIPETINIVELATLADMLCLEGLKEVIMYTLKVKYCHFFHKPCNSNSCIGGVLECLPLAAAYGLDEIYRKSLRWITKYFIRVWPTKGFANLPKELQDKCYKQHVVHMSAENVLETIMGCEKLEATITNVKWAQPVINMNLKLHEAAIKYLTQHFATVISSDSFLRIGKEDVWTVTRLEETLLSISRTLSPDQSCQSYKKIKCLLSNIRRDEEMEIVWKAEFVELMTQLESSVEDCLVRQAGKAARTSSWAQMDLPLRKKIQEMACLVFAPGPRAASISKQQNSQTMGTSQNASGAAPFKQSRTDHQSLDGRSPRLGERSNIPSRPSSDRGQRSLGSTPVMGRSKVPPPSAAANSKRSTVSKLPQQSSSNLPTATSTAQPKGQSPRPAQRSVTVSNTNTATSVGSTAQQPKTSGVPRPRISTKISLSQVKSRYLEPKATRKETQEPTNTSQINRPGSGGRRLSGGSKVISSSDSSRTSSPATSRVTRPTPKQKTPTFGTARVTKVNSSGGDSSKRESSDGSGGNPSPLLANSQAKRTSTFRVATKSSAAKAAQPRNINQHTLNNNSQRHIQTTARSGTFLKDSPSVSKRMQANRQ